MEIVNGQIKNLADAVDNTDGVTAEQSTVLYRNMTGTATKQILVREQSGQAVAASGSLTIYLTDDGTASGVAVFPNNVFKETLNLWVDDATTQFQFGNYTLSNGNRTLTLNINRLGTVLLGIIQFLAAANGTTVHYRIKGN